MISVRRLTGEALGAALEDVAQLRIAVFRAFPYLYDGDAAYERAYLQTYRDSADAILVGAFDGARLVGHAFFDQREAHARDLKRDYSAFCGVIRPADHPLRPSGYAPLDPFWRKRGYAPVDGAIAHYAWKDLDQTDEMDHQLQFWMRAL